MPRASADALRLIAFHNDLVVAGSSYVWTSANIDLTNGDLPYVQSKNRDGFGRTQRLGVNNCLRASKTFIAGLESNFAVPGSDFRTPASTSAAPMRIAT